MRKHLSKKDVEGFLSCFIYNAYGQTNVHNVPMLVFTDENYAARMLNHRLRANPPPADVNEHFDKIEVSDEQIHNSRVKDVMRQLEDKVFPGPVKMYQVFKQFDKDGDGYVSYADFEDHLRGLRV